MRTSAALLLFGCACGAATPSVQLQAVSPNDTQALSSAADAFYSADSVEALQAALRRAERAGSDSALYHEIAYQLARLQARLGDQLDHVLAAVADTNSASPSLHMHFLNRVNWTLDERRRAAAVLESLSRNHPAPDVRALAATALGVDRHMRADIDGLDEAKARVTGKLDFALIGIFDNENGKGFDTAYPPEAEINFDAVYSESTGDVRWRLEVPYTRATHRLDLQELLSPDENAIAYATGVFEAPAAGPYELRLVSSEPLKVWVDGRLLFSARPITGYRSEHLVIPVPLKAGLHRVLIKTAQEKGSWVLGARVTGHDGRHGGVVIRPPTTNVPANTEPLAQVEVDALIEARVAHMPDGARKDYLRADWAVLMGFRHKAVKLADAFVQTHPESILGRYLLAGEAWDHGQRGRTGDLLGALDKQFGASLLFIRLQHARFLRQESLSKKARELLLATQRTHPDNADVYLRLARQYAHEGWKEDECRAYEQALARRPQWMPVLMKFGRCQAQLGFKDVSSAIYERVRRELPAHGTATTRLHDRARAQSRYDRAEELAAYVASVWPESKHSWRRLAETRRLARKPAEAKSALQRALKINPTDAETHKRLARLAYQQGSDAEAIRHWQRAAELDPEDEAVAHRLSFLAAGERQPWELDAPDEDRIAAAVKARTSVEPSSGANSILLLDHSVVRFNVDGSTNSIVTMVLHVVNEQGLDRAKKMSMASGGRVRVMHAYAISPDGTRTKVSSIRKRVARFRGLKVGSTVVLQYRHDHPPVGYLAKRVARWWWFEQPNLQYHVSEWVVWAPSDTPLHQHVIGDVKATEEKRGDLIRRKYTRRDVPALVVERPMPPINEVASRVLLSTVPSWDDFLEWEKALLVDAFRDDAALKARTKALLEGAETVQEKVLRIHEYLMREIRYEQEYETHIAGVKPHAAPVVLERAYGDCKDKAVLFITMARLAGIDVHYALLRTRNYGQVVKAVPMQQFNHAIVYVPKQPGFDEGRFFDPTADAMDVLSLRPDDPGTLALVLDPKTNQSKWREIPFQTPDYHRQAGRSTLRLAEDGAAEGSIEFEMVGNPGAWLRKVGRNQKLLEQSMQRIVSSRFASGRVEQLNPLQLDDLRSPARVRAAVRLPTFARREGRELRIRLTTTFDPSYAFRLAERRYPLQLVTPSLYEWHSEIAIPRNATVRRMPPDTVVESECFRFSRRSKKRRGKVTADQAFELRCDRIPIDAYAEYRSVVERLQRAYRDELVVTLND